MKEACIKDCKFMGDHKCTLYHTKLEMESFDDPYDQGMIVTFAKCEDCQEKELSCSIDIKIREIYSFYHAFREEMDILFGELDDLSYKRQDIYREEKE